MQLHRRQILTYLACLPISGTFAAPLASVAMAASAREIGWEDLIPAGVPEAEIIDKGEFDEERDIWRPVYDDNANRFNVDLGGKQVKIPGYIIPLEYSGDGVSTFILAPYAGACVHVPPPPPNQLVYVTTSTPYPNDKIFDAIWVTGTIKVNRVETELAEIGYEIDASEIKQYQW